ncbi:MAG: CocE/NonD family hydrolase [Clostridiales Family XIII bacterium]|jgi:predicted acyl esterase|nr:CocE/NonD family hydrolase [Clostridiales Family XIII bacterium]
MDNNMFFTKKHEYWDEVIYAKTAETGIDTGDYKPVLSWPPLQTETKVIPKGYSVGGGYRDVAVDMVYMRDQPVTLRDGVTIYVDIFRPTDESKTYPVILAWTPYGKIDPPNNYDLYANRADMDKDQSCGLATFEGPEPDYWVYNEYIVAVADSRGSTNSEGAMPFLGHEEALDAYDCIEWLGVQPYSSGKVTLIGNSWLGVMQYFTADLKPPHLAAIAPWEGYSDIYRDVVCRGGIPGAEFLDAINQTLRLPEGIESLHYMLEKYPFINEYWAKDKRAVFTGIEIPAYFVASWSSCVHPYGTLRAWNKIASKDKWLRIHNRQEWIDQATPKYRDDLRDFFDYFLKGKGNGWPERTAKARVSLLDAFGPDVVDREEADFPIPGTDYRKLYLNGADDTLSYAKPEAEVKASYEVGANKDGQIQFRIRFDEDTNLCGYFKAHLFVSTDSGNDMDLFAYVTKEDSLGVANYPLMLGVDYMGAEARLRVSHRKIINAELHDWQHEHKTEELIEPEQIVEIETIFWPTGVVYRKGEILVLTISARELQMFEFPTPRLPTRNEGTHTIYTGGKYDSYITIPVV